MALLAWVYFSAQILFFGAELTRAYATEYKHKFRPSRGAISLTEEMRIHQGIPHNQTVEEAFKKQKIA